MAAVWIKVDGTMKTITPEHEGGPFHVFELVCYISIGVISFKTLPGGFLLAYNPDAWDMALDFNEFASNLLNKDYSLPGLVYGDVIVLPEEEVDRSKYF